MKYIVNRKNKDLKLVNYNVDITGMKVKPINRVSGLTIKADKITLVDSYLRDSYISQIIDKKTDLAITKKCIIGGIPLNRKGIYLGNFEDTLVQQFLDKEFTYDIVGKEIQVKKTEDRIDRTDFLI